VILFHSEYVNKKAKQPLTAADAWSWLIQLYYPAMCCNVFCCTHTRTA